MCCPGLVDECVGSVVRHVLVILFRVCRSEVSWQGLKSWNTGCKGTNPPSSTAIIVDWKILPLPLRDVDEVHGKKCGAMTELGECLMEAVEATAR